MWDIGGSISWREGVDLAFALAVDPSTHTAARLNDWAEPLTERLVIRTAVDLWYGANSDGKSVPWLEFVQKPTEIEKPSDTEVATARQLLDANSAFG